MTIETKRAILSVRFPKLIEWTNPGVKNYSGINNEVLDAAIEDAEGDFEDLAGVIFDETDKRHVRIFKDRVKFHLLENGAGLFGGTSSLKEQTENALRELRKRTNANRLNPGLKLKDPLDAPYFNSLNNLGYDLGGNNNNYHRYYRE